MATGDIKVHVPPPQRLGSKENVLTIKNRFGAIQSIWKQILEEATKTADFQDSHILVLGRKDVGKSSIIRALQVVGAPNNALEQMEEYGNVDAVSALDFAFLNVRNVEDEDPSQALAKCNLWIIQHSHHRPLLMDKLKPEFLDKLCVLIFLDMSKPWAIREDLIYWLSFANSVICDMLTQMDVEESDQLLAKLAHYMAHYKDKVVNEKAEDFIKRQMEHPEERDAEDVTIMMNLGVPIVVCVAKSDTYKALETRNTQGHNEVISAHLRNGCIPYGAALIYAHARETKNTRNIELLYRYLMHRIYDFDFREAADCDSKDGLFLPSGWDSVKEIETFAAGTVAEGLTKPFESIIIKPVSVNVFNELDIRKTEDMNTFLGNALQGNPSVAAGARPDRRDERGDRAESRKDKDRDRERDRGDRDRGGDRKDRERDRRDRGDRKDRGERPPTSSRGEKLTSLQQSLEKGSAGGEKEKPLKNYFQSLLIKRQADAADGSSSTARDNSVSPRRRSPRSPQHKPASRQVAPTPPPTPPAS
eukprot:GHVN01085042.1.p1 GENE.GHVN01085042.1~~GHVN01085042.1.p1  ORF type:complete len:532 (+),score=78.99 GHVN01085042.1:324-1919(+)